jgi:hypothetical protein
MAASLETLSLLSSPAQHSSFHLFVFAFPFFACAKKGTKKAQPIFLPTLKLRQAGMRNISYIEHFLCRNRR